MMTDERIAKGGLRCLAWVGVWALVATAYGATPPRDPSLRSSANYLWPRQQQVVLDGPWTLAWTDPSQTVALPENMDRLDWFPTTVPGEVHWALYRAGKSPHPYVGLNAKQMRWVEDKSWWFRKRFVFPADMAKDRHVSLILEGVDYYGFYWLNGRYLGRSEGAFGAVAIPVDQLKPDAENELVVRVDCGGYKLGKKGGAAPASLVKSELWSGWQLGAHDLNTVGIWQPVRLVARERVCLERPFVQTLTVAEDTARVRASVEISAEHGDDGIYDVAVTLGGRGFAAEPIRGTTRIDLRNRTVLAHVDLTVPRPRLWWPNGLGEHPMYEAQIVLTKNGKPLDRLVVPFGIRSVELDRGPTPSASHESRGWIFHVNGRPLFVKGTNCMPIDALADVSPEQYEWALSLAHDAGIQMIRVWGGGILETDVFYELCDRFGIMVWQDFPLTCGWRAEKIDRQIWRNTVKWTIFRLRNHPSLVFWCGGNEFPPDDRANADLVFMLDRYTRILDGTRPFMGASPDEGDVHDYPQWDASWAYRSALVTGPFVSEWGSHGMPSPQTYAEIVGPEESKSRIGPTLLKMSEKLMAQQYPEIIHHWVEFDSGRLPQMLARGSAYDRLAGATLDRFSDAVNAGAAEFYKVSAEAARTGYPRNGGLLFWVWKRPWPIVGIQICDGLGQPLPVYYDVKRAFGSPWPCLVPPHLSYAPGDRVEMKTAVLTEILREGLAGCRLTARLIGPDLVERQRWDDPAASGCPVAAGVGCRAEFRVPRAERVCEVVLLRAAGSDRLARETPGPKRVLAAMPSATGGRGISPQISREPAATTGARSGALAAPATGKPSDYLVVQGARSPAGRRQSRASSRRGPQCGPTPGGDDLDPRRRQGSLRG